MKRNRLLFFILTCVVFLGSFSFLEAKLADPVSQQFSAKKRETHSSREKSSQALKEKEKDSGPPKKNTAKRISDVKVEGNRRLETASILAYADVKKGDVYTSELASEVIKRVYNTGIFQSVQVRFEKDTLVIVVKERPVIAQIVFVNNSILTSSELGKEISLTVGSNYSDTKMQSDLRRIKSLYARNGYQSATVTSSLENMSENRIRVVYTIRESVPSYIKSIQFNGNKAFTSQQLRSVIYTREWAFWRFLADSHKYNSERLDYDKELLRQYYYSHGYIDFTITNTSVWLSPDAQYFVITHNLKEGDQYRFGHLSIQSDVPGLSSSLFSEEIAGKTGGVYDPQIDQDVINNIVYKAWLKNFPFVHVSAKVKKNENNKTIDIVYHIEKSARLYIRKVNIMGNHRTIDSVIRRALIFSDSDPFNQAILKKSYYNLRALDYFESIRFDPVILDDQPNQIDLNVEVKEKSTGALSLSLGYSTLDGILGGVSLADRNVLGSGRYLGTSFRSGSKAREVRVDFADPAFFNRDLGFAVGTSYEWTDLQKESSYNSRVVGFNTRLTFPLSENASLTTAYYLARQDITDVGAGASMSVKDVEGISVRSILGFSYKYDRKDDPIDPKNGWDFKWQENFSGVGGTIRFLDSKLGLQMFASPKKAPNLTSYLRLSAAYLTGLDTRTTINDRYAIGGENFPGFDRSGAGPRDLATGDALGSQLYFMGVAGLRVPNGLPASIGLRTDIFTQFGYSGLVDKAPSTAVTKLAYRQTVGISFEFAKTLGGLKFIFAVPVVKQDYDKDLTFLLSATQSF